MKVGGKEIVPSLNSVNASPENIQKQDHSKKKEKDHSKLILKLGILHQWLEVNSHLITKGTSYTATESTSHQL